MRSLFSLHSDLRCIQFVIKHGNAAVLLSLRPTAVVIIYLIDVSFVIVFLHRRLLCARSYIMLIVGSCCSLLRGVNIVFTYLFVFTC